MDLEDERRKARRKWVRLLEETGDAGLVCRRCGISRPTLRKWSRRFQEEGEEGLRSRSRRPRRSPRRRIGPAEEESIVALRRDRNLGPKGIQSELLRLEGSTFSTATIWKVLARRGLSRIRRTRPVRRPRTYSRRTPGDRVQMDTMQVAPGCIQFTAIDDCTRMRVLGWYPRRTAANAVHFLEERVVEELPFPIQRLQTDRGGEFFALTFQKALRRQRIKFRPIRPRSPHLNGKVERSQQTDRIEFWATVDLESPELELHLDEWQHFYNWFRPHSALGGMTPADRLGDLLWHTPSREDVSDAYVPEEEPFRERDYARDLETLRLKRSL